MARTVPPAQSDPYVPKLPLIPRLNSYVQLLLLLSISIYYLPITILTHPLLLLSSPSSFREKWFENFFNVIGPQMALSPLQVDHVESLMSRAHGISLELGPGTGEQTHHFKAPQITHMYAAEPNAFLHPKLLEKAKTHGLAAKYTPLACGAQPGSLLPELQEIGLIPQGSSTLPEEGIFDSVLAIKSMCSAPAQEVPATVAVIQALLKPGGEFLFFEHVANDRDWLTTLFARVVNIIWPAFMGGCRLDGKLDQICQAMGGWEEKEIVTTPEFQGFEVFRYVRGRCVKAGS